MMVTWEGLGAVLAVLLGVLFCGCALLAYFGASMSSNPYASGEAERFGCRLGLIGLALLAIAGWVLLA